MGKRRNAAKTGDKKLYQNRNNASLERNEKPQDIDDFHQERDENFLALEESDDPSDFQDDIMNKDNVLDLGIGGDSSEDDDSDDAGNSLAVKELDDPRKGSDDDTDDDSESDSYLEDVDESDPRQWGKKKSLYYNGDTADLELGVQEEDDAFVEEEAAREVQASRLKQMQEDDFVPSDDEHVEASTGEEGNISSVRNIAQLSIKEKRKLLRLQHPELIPVVSHFSEILKEMKDSTNVAIGALMDGDRINGDTAKSVGTTKQGQQFLLTKSLMEQSVVLNAALYLLVKSSLSQQDDAEVLDAIEVHPVMLQLKRSNAMLDNLSDSIVKKAGGLQEQVQSLMKAASLLDVDESESESNEDKSDHTDEKYNEDMTGYSPGKSTEESLPELDIDDANDATKDYSKDDRVPAKLDTLGEARFGLRQHEVNLKNKQRRKKVHDLFDVGDDHDGALQSSGLASTINAIDQRAAKRKRKAKSDTLSDDLGYFKDEVTAGIRIMEDGLENGRENEFDEKEDREFGEIPGDLDNIDDDIDFYDTMAKKAKKSKQMRKDLHKVAPKYPTFEGEVDGERAISRTILKNRGLVPHKNRINRNPRVKKRMQYQKALVRRKGAVREVRTHEGKYDGESTGIKSRISRSRKLIS